MRRLSHLASTPHPPQAVVAATGAMVQVPPPEAVAWVAPSAGWAVGVAARSVARAVRVDREDVLGDQAAAQGGAGMSEGGEGASGATMGACRSHMQSRTLRGSGMLGRRT